MQSLKQEEQMLVTRLTLLQVLLTCHCLEVWWMSCHFFLQSSAVGVLTDAQCAELASKLASHWRKLAPKLGLAEEKVGVSCEI